MIPRFRSSPAVLVTLALLVPSLSASVGCSSTAEKGANNPTAIKAKRRADGTVIDDHSMCDYKNREGLEAGETAGPGAIQPNIRRVWKVFGGASRRRILVCREVDTNLDGIKDVVRLYNDEGQSKEERADTNYDGKVDTWNVFAKGRLAEVRLDHNHDGEPDEWKIYIGGELSRIKRDTDFNKLPDVWEMYRKGRLERMGVDLDGDKRVDRWDHDTEWRRKLIESEKRKREEEDLKRKKRKKREEKVRKDAEAAAKKAAGG